MLGPNVPIQSSLHLVRANPEDTPYAAKESEKLKAERDGAYKKVKKTRPVAPLLKLCKVRNTGEIDLAVQ